MSVLSRSFDKLTREQLNTPSSRKWSFYPETIGAWVAEMDFGTAPEITTRLHDAVDRAHLGYISPPVVEEMARATALWQQREFGWDVPWQRVHPVADVMAGFEIAVTSFSPAGAGVIVPTPAYMPFFNVTPALGREVFEVPGIVTDGRWTHDLAGIDAAFRAGAHTLVLCNPQNPTGTALTRAELLGIASVVEAHHGRVFADEVHAPLFYGRQRHIPYASLSAVTAGHTITATSASKAWNLPGLKTAQLITSNSADEERFAAIGFAALQGASLLGLVAATAAFTQGQPWLDDVLGYLDGNRRSLGDLLKRHLPEVGYSLPDATYIAWLDCSRLGIDGSVADFFRTEAGVTLTDGAQCGRGFEQHVRLVFAMPGPLLEEAVIAMADAVARHRLRQGSERRAGAAA
jgi:cystathionine beta-lyase